MTKLPALLSVIMIALPMGAFAAGPATTSKPATTAPKPVTPAATAAAKLAPADIQATFGTGMSFAATNVGGRTYSYVLKTDGTASRTAKGAKIAETGTWRAADPGYCATWGKGTEQCYAIRSATAAASYDVLDKSNKVIAHWTKPS